jgi:hypothetical protein
MGYDGSEVITGSGEWRVRKWGGNNTVITLEEAKGIVSAAEHKAQQMGLPMNITVMDAGRNLVALHRLTPAASARDQRQCGTSGRTSGAGWRSNWTGTGGTLG